MIVSRLAPTHLPLSSARSPSQLLKDYRWKCQGK